MSTVERTARVADTVCDLIPDRQLIRHRRRISDILQENNKRSVKKNEMNSRRFVQLYYAATHSMVELLNVIYPRIYL